MHAGEKNKAAVDFLKVAVAHYTALGVHIQRVRTENGAPIAPASLPAPARRWDQAELPQPYRPQTNGKAERFILACL